LSNPLTGLAAWRQPPLSIIAFNRFGAAPGGSKDSVESGERLVEVAGVDWNYGEAVESL
jgi:hypothetical protein